MKRRPLRHASVSAVSSLVLVALLVPSGADAAPPEVTSGRFTHQAHEKSGLKLECSACHGSPANGQLSMPGKDHKPCSNEGCHAAEYRKRNSQLCFACHTGNEPWVKNNPTRSSFKLPAGVVSEFYVGFSHKAHLSRGLGGKDPGAACLSCHFDQAGTKPPQLPAGLLAPSHALCASCHAEVATPHMPECAKCHAFDGGAKAGPAANADAASPDPWRVRAKFAHESHRVDIRGAKPTQPGRLGWAGFDRASAAPLLCDGCHRGVIDTPVGQRPPRPKMEGCAACHDGQHAFKATGHECARCHGPSANASAEQPPKSTPVGEPQPK